MTVLQDPQRTKHPNSGLDIERVIARLPDWNLARLQQWNDEHLLAHYYSGRAGRGFRHYYLVSIAITAALGPIYFALMGAVEWTAFYLTAVFLYGDRLGLEGFLYSHFVFALSAPLLVSISLKIRRYQKSPKEEIKGRFPLSRTFW